MAQRNARILLVDGTAYLFRCHYAVPPRQAPDGTPVGAVAGLARMILSLLRRTEPSHVAIAFDAGRRTFRNDLYPPYKADRGPPPEELVPQFALAPAVCRALGLAVSSVKGFEADDLLATLARRAERAGWHVTVVSGDKDLAQLVSEKVTLWECVRDEVTRPAQVRQRFGVDPEQMADFQGLTGDSTDHFPGLKGVGPRTAAKLLATAGTLDRLLARPELALEAGIRNAKAVEAALRSHADEVRLFRRLAHLRRDAPTGLRARDLVWRGALREDAQPLFDRLGLAGMLRGVPRWIPSPA